MSPFRKTGMGVYPANRSPIGATGSAIALACGRNKSARGAPAAATLAVSASAHAFSTLSLWRKVKG